MMLLDNCVQRLTSQSFGFVQSFGLIFNKVVIAAGDAMMSTIMPAMSTRRTAMVCRVSESSRDDAGSRQRI
jgi:hypothetical protein